VTEPYIYYTHTCAHGLIIKYFQQPCTSTY